MPIKNKSQINDNINLKINDNTTEDITPEDLRDVLKDINDSALNRLDNAKNKANQGRIDTFFKVNPVEKTKKSIPKIVGLC